MQCDADFALRYDGMTPRHFRRGKYLEGIVEKPWVDDGFVIQPEAEHCLLSDSFLSNSREIRQIFDAAQNTNIAGFIEHWDSVLQPGPVYDLRIGGPCGSKFCIVETCSIFLAHANSRRSAEAEKHDRAFFEPNFRLFQGPAFAFKE